MQKILYLLMASGFLFSILGCNSFIYDDLSNCPQGVNFGFYRQTPCESRPSYPVEIKQVRVFAFDKNNLLVAEYHTADLALSADYLLKTPFNQTGTFTFVAWGGSELDSYSFSAFKTGETTKEQMFVSLKRQSNDFIEKPTPLYYGISEPLTIEERGHIGSVFDLVTFNMQELTNRLRFTIYGLSEKGNYNVSITDDNGIYDFNGGFAKDARFNYITNVKRSDNILKANFVLMKLAEGRNAQLTIQNKITGKIIYAVNLVEYLLMYRGDSGEPPYSLECDHDYNVDIVFNTDPEDESTYILMKIVVNDWNVVTRPVILG